MPDLSPLPPLAEPPDFAARAEVFDAAARTARRRVRTSLAALSTGVAVLVAVAVLPDGATPTSGLAPAGASATTPSAPPSETASAGADPATGEPGTGPGEASATPGDDASPSATPSAAPEPRPEQTSELKEPVLRGTTLAIVPAETPCTLSEAGEQWCLGNHVAEYYPSGRWARLVHEVCRASDREGTLRFPHGAEQEVALGRGDEVVWEREYGATPGPDTVRVPAGHCARWTIGWQVADGAGRALPPGEYEVRWRLTGSSEPEPTATPDPTDALFPIRWSVGYTITVR